MNAAITVRDGKKRVAEQIRQALWTKRHLEKKTGTRRRQKNAELRGVGVSDRGHPSFRLSVGVPSEPEPAELESRFGRFQKLRYVTRRWISAESTQDPPRMNHLVAHELSIVLAEEVLRGDSYPGYGSVGAARSTPRRRPTQLLHVRLQDLPRHLSG